jgi:hypothetical protein
VFKFGDRQALAKDKIVPFAVVEKNITDLWEEVKHTREISRCKSGKDHEGKLRRWLVSEGHPERTRWIAFDETHPLIFDRCIDKDTTDKEITALLHMLHLQETGRPPEDLKAYIWENFSVPEDVYREKHGNDSKIMDIPAGMSF